MGCQNDTSSAWTRVGRAMLVSSCILSPMGAEMVQHNGTGNEQHTICCSEGQAVGPAALHHSTLPHPRHCTSRVLYPN